MRMSRHRHAESDGSPCDLRTDAIKDDAGLRALGSIECSEDGVRSKVIEAHRILMGLSEDNRVKFQELVTTLEKTQ